MSFDPVEILPPDFPSSIAEGNYYKVQRIDIVFQLLVEMIEVLQSLAISQAERLQFLTEWQKAYTDLMNQVPTFTQNSDLFGGTEDEESNLRDDMNRLNSTFTEQLRGSRSLISDDAKALQSNLNQTNDAVSQQSNMATALLQQLSTILTTIYR